MRLVKTLAICFATAFALSASAFAADAPLRAPADVKKALGTMNRVVGHMGRLVDAKNLDRLSHENEELVEGAEALEKAIANEPPAFKTKVMALVKKAEAQSAEVAKAGTKDHDEAKARSALTTLGANVKEVVAVFPADVQPAP